MRAAYEQSLKPIPLPGAVKLADVMRTVSELLPESGIVTNGAGNFAAFVHRYFQYKGYRTCLAPTSGSMGYGLPAAIAAKPRIPPSRGQRAGRRRFPHDGTGTGHRRAIRAAGRRDHRQQRYVRHHPRPPGARVPRRIVGTTLVNPDFAAYARSFGADGYTIEATADFAPAFKAALASSKPSVIELKLDPEALSPRKTLTEVREQR